MAGGYAAKLDDTIREDSLDHAADRFRYVYETYLKDTGANIYLSVIPDKNYFLSAENGYPVMDYDRFFALMREKVDFAQFVDLTDTLSLESYYRTDLHWRQEALLPTAQALADAMGVSLTEDFTEVTLDTPFYGVYRGQSALPMESDKLAYLTNSMLEGCRVRQRPVRDLPLRAKVAAAHRESERKDGAQAHCLSRFLRRKPHSAARRRLPRDHADRHSLSLARLAWKICRF